MYILTIKLFVNLLLSKKISDLLVIGLPNIIRRSPIDVADWEAQISRSLPQELAASLPSFTKCCPKAKQGV
jgi:hypothetical protein